MTQSLEAAARPTEHQLMLFALDRVATDLEQQVKRMAAEGDYNCQFPESEAASLRRAIALLSNARPADAEPRAWLVTIDDMPHLTLVNPNTAEGAYDGCEIQPLYASPPSPDRTQGEPLAIDPDSAAYQEGYGDGILEGRGLERSEQDAECAVCGAKAVLRGEMPKMPTPDFFKQQGEYGFRHMHESLWLFTAEQMHAYAAQCRAAAIPEGFVVVPREPTEEMRKAGRHALMLVADKMRDAGMIARDSIDFWQRTGHYPADPIYQAFIAAAPPLAAAPKGEGK